MKKVRGTVAFLLVFVLSFSVIPQNVLAAKKKVKLSKKSVTVTVGKTVKVKLKNNKKKVKWTVTSGKKNVKLSKKKKTSVTIHGKKVGKAKVQAKVGKKKFVCKVTVKKAGTNQNADKNNGKKTAKPTVKPTEKPVLPSTPTPKPTEKPVLPSSPTPLPTKVPEQTMLPPDETPGPTVEPVRNNQGLYAENEELIISSIAFEKEVDYYLSYNNIYVCDGEANSLKDIVPDVTKCEFTVYCYGKKAEVKSVSDVEWNEKTSKGKGSYTFSITAALDGKEYTKTAKMMLGLSRDETIDQEFDNGFTLLTLQADNREYELERGLAKDPNGDSSHFSYYYFKDKDVNTEDIKNAGTKKITGVYEDEKITLNIENISASTDSVMFRPSSYTRGKQFLNFSHVGIYVKVENYFVIDAFTSTKGAVKYRDYMVGENQGFIYDETIEDGKSLKDIFTDLSINLKIYRTIYRNVYCVDNSIRNVVWHDEPYYEGKEDKGYYTFDLVITVDGKEIKQSYVLVEQQRKYTVSGKLETEDGQPIANAEVSLDKWNGEFWEQNDVIKTDEKGNFTTKQSKGEYQIQLGKSFTVEGDMQHDEKLPVYKMSGTVKRTGAQTMDIPNIWISATENSDVLYGSDLDDDNHYYRYLTKGNYIIYVGSYEFDRFEVTGSEERDITLDCARIFGKCSNTYLYKNVNNDDYSTYISGTSGWYEVYLKPGTYQVIDGDTVIDTVDVALGDTRKDYIEHSCKGNLLDVSGLTVPEEMRETGSYTIFVERNGEQYKSFFVPMDGEENAFDYELDLLDGEYEFFYADTSIAKVTINGSDVVKDLTLPLKYVKIKLFDAENHVIPLSEQNYVKETKGSGNEYYLTEGPVGYSAHAMLPLGSYVFGGENKNIQDMQNATFTVTKEDDVVSVNTQLYRVSGYCKLNGVNASDDARITFFDKDSSSTCAVNEMEDGKYSVYVSAGEYIVKISNSEGILASEKITVTDASVEKNFDIEVGKLTGKLSWENGSSFTDFDTNMWQIGLRMEEPYYSGRVAGLGKDGSFEVKDILFGTYDVMVYSEYSNAYVNVGTITIDSKTKSRDFVISGYAVHVKMVDSDGNPMKGEQFSFVNTEDETDTKYFCTNTEGEAYLIVSKPGTYKAMLRKESYGTVTVTDKNVSAILRKSEP